MDEQNMSDMTNVSSVKDLIRTAFGPGNKNTVNFKLIQTILHILARQLRLLEQDVEIRFDEIAEVDDNRHKYTSSSSSESEEDVRDAGRERAGEKEGVKKERAEKGGKEGKKERSEKGEKGEKKEKQGKGEKEDAEGKVKRGEKREKKEKRGKGDKEDAEGKGERAEKGEKKEKRRKGEKSSKDREGKDGSKDRDDKDREDKKSRDKRSPSKSARGRKGDDDGDEGEERRGGRTRERGGERGGRHDGRKGSPDISASKQDSGTSITVTEASRKGGRGKGGTDKILVAERGPAARTRPARVGSIEVVTASQFALLERAVKQLEHYSGPPPVPALPDNQQLRKDLAEGRASLSDTMQAVQLNARVQAAEQGLSRMAELLTQLARAGALPPELAGRIGQMQAELDQAALAAAAAGAGTARLAGAERGGTDTGLGGAGAGTGLGGAGAGKTGKGHKGGRGMKSTADPQTTSIKPSVESVGATGVAGAVGTAGAAEAAEAAQPPQPPPGVTHQEMNDVLLYMKEAINKEIQKLTARANHSADMASSTSRSVAQKLATGLHIDGRITELFSQTRDYAEQLSGFDSGLTTQMSSFQEQMTSMRKDLTGGLTVLASANNNAATAAIMELGERYEGLLIELDNTVHVHHHLTSLQQQLSDELKSLVECVEMLREQKADRDEVLDGLRDKADLSRLVGLLYEKDFAQARYEIENRLVKCYDKFHKQDQVWQTALGDLTVASQKKAEHIILVALKENVTKELNDIQEKLRKLEMLLGEPKAALLMRQLAKDATCGSCLTRAMMPPVDATYGKPLKIPPLRPSPLGAEDLCLGDAQLTLPDTRDHTCHRWVGGSHTLVGRHLAREKAGEADLQAIPTKKFDGYGTDGRLYMMEEELQPCAECNKSSTVDPEHLQHSPTSTGADGRGDQAKV